MKHQSIPEMVDQLARPSKMLDSTLTEINGYIAAVRTEAEHYGITESKQNKFTLRELMTEINRRKEQAQVKKTFEKI